MATTGETAIRLPRSYAKDEMIEVKTRIIHPNHNGRRRYKDEGFIAEYYIRTIDVFYGDEHVIGVEASGAISQNPYFTFMLKAARSAPLRVEWVDTRGRKYTETVEVKV